MTYSHDGPGNTSLKSFPLSLQHISRHDASSGWSKVRRTHLEVRGLLWSFLEDTYSVCFYASYGEGCQRTWHHVLQIQFKHPYNNQLTILTPLRISIVHNIAIVAARTMDQEEWQIIGFPILLCWYDPTVLVWSNVLCTKCAVELR